MIAPVGVAVGPPEEAGSEGDVRARALQVGHEGLADLRLSGELPQVNAAHPPLGDVPHEEHPPAQPASGEGVNEFFGAGEPGKRRRLHHWEAGGHLKNGRPARSLRLGELGVIARTHVHADPPETPAAPVLDVGEIPARVAAAAFLRALEAADPAIGPDRIKALRLLGLPLLDLRVSGLRVHRHPPHPLDPAYRP